MRCEICDAADAPGAYDSGCFHRNMQTIYYPGFIIGGMAGEAAAC
jgi:hypothetical protein